jgi:hypothetical protein
MISNVLELKRVFDLAYELHVVQGLPPKEVQERLQRELGVCLNDAQLASVLRTVKR